MRFQRRAPSAPDDRGVVQLFEAIVIGLILISVTFFVLTFDTPSAGESQARLDLQGVSSNALRAALHTYHDDPRYDNNFLSRAVAEALQHPDDPRMLRDFLEAYFPPGTAYNVHLSNGFGRTEVIHTRDPTGQTAGASVAFEPHWRYVFSRPDIRVYGSGSPMALGTYMIPVYDSNPVEDDGVVVRVQALGYQDFSPGELMVEPPLPQPDIPFNVTAYTTAITDPTPQGKRLTAVQLAMDCNGAPCYSADLASDEPMEWDAITSEWHMNVTVVNTGALALSPGSTLTLDLPVGFSIEPKEDQPEFADWQVARFVQGPMRPAQIKAITTTTLCPVNVVVLPPCVGSTELRLPFDVAWPPDDTRYPFKTVYATMENGTAARSSFVWRVADTGASSYTGGDMRTMHVSAPKPFSSDDLARWAVVIASPVGLNEVASVDFVSEDGQPIWDCDDGPIVESPASWGVMGVGSGDCAPDAFRVTGTPQLVPNGLFELRLQIKGAAEPSSAIGSPGVPDERPQATFANDFSPHAAPLRVARDVFIKYEPPRRPSGFGDEMLLGYPNTISLPWTDAVVMPWEAALPYRTTTLRGNATYTLAPLLDLDAQNSAFAVRDAMQAAKLDISPRTSELGGQVTFVIDVSDLTRFIASNYGLTQFNATTRIYPPWSLDSGITTPDLTFNHVTGQGVTTPDAQTVFDLEPFWGDQIGAQDVVLGAGNGQVITLDGDSGKVLGGFVYTLPAVGAGDRPSVRVLTRNQDAASELVAGPSLEESTLTGLSNELASAPIGPKPHSNTLALNNSLDFDGDGEPDVLGVFANTGSYTTKHAGGAQSSDLSILRLYSSQSGGALGSEWANLISPGTTTRAGFARAGHFPAAVPTVWATTGPLVGVTHHEEVNTELPDPPGSTQPEQILNYGLDVWNNLLSVSAAWNNYDAGLKSWHTDLDASPAWTVPGVAFIDVIEADLDGDGWSELYAGDDMGNVYAFNAAQPILPVDGWSFADSPLNGVDMWDTREGFAVGKGGIFLHTRDSWNNMKGAIVVNAVQNLPWDIDAIDPEDAWFTGTGLVGRTADRFTMFQSFTGFATRATLFRVAGGDVTPITTLPRIVSLQSLNITGAHAVSWDEAWFSATGIGLEAGKGFVLHTADGGVTFSAAEWDCDVTCGFNGIEERMKGGQIYAFGDHGIMVKRTTQSMADQVHFGGAWPLRPNATLQLNLTVAPDAPVPPRVETMTLNWDDSAWTIAWLDSVKVDRDDGAGPVTWWGPGAVPTYSTPAGSAFGAPPTAVVDARNYTAATGNADKTVLVPGSEPTMTLGPFRRLAGTAYTTEDLPPGVLYLTVTYTDGSEETYTVPWAPAVQPVFGNGDVALNLTSPSPADRITHLQVSWNDGSADVGWLGYAKLDGDADGPLAPVDLWTPSGVTEVPAHLHGVGVITTLGAANNTVLTVYDTNALLPGWTNAHGPGNADVGSSTPVTLRLGGFKESSGVATYTRATLPAMFLTVKVTWANAGLQNYDLLVAPPRGVAGHGDSGMWEHVHENEAGYFCNGVALAACEDVRGMAFREGGAMFPDRGMLVGTQGKMQMQLEVLPGMRAWINRTSPLPHTLNDVTFRTDLELVAVGAAGTVVASFDGGLTWTITPIGLSVTDPGGALHGIASAGDHAAYIVGYGGGGVRGVFWVVNGFASRGSAVTELLATGGDFTHIRVDFDAIFESTAGKIWVNASRDGSTWFPIKAKGPTTVNNILVKTFAGEVPGTGSSVRLRFELVNQLDFTRSSPAIRGDVRLARCDLGAGACDVASPQWTAFATLDLNSTAAFDPDLLALEVGTVDRWLDRDTHEPAWTGEMRLRPAEVRWYARLNGTDVSPVADLALAPYRGDPANTQLIAATGAVVDARHIADPLTVGKGIFVLDALTGTPLATSDWLPRFGTLDFEGVPTHVAGAPERVFLAVQKAAWWPLSKNAFYPLDPQTAPVCPPTEIPHPASDIVTIQDGPTGPNQDGRRDPVVATLGASGSPAEILRFSSSDGCLVWAAKPTLPGTYTFIWGVPYDSTFGLYIVETRISWYIGDSVDTTFRTPNTNPNLLQTVRLFNTFIVAPPGGALSPSPAYAVEVISWLEHWG